LMIRGIFLVIIGVARMVSRSGLKKPRTVRDPQHTGDPPVIAPG